MGLTIKCLTIQCTVSGWTLAVQQPPQGVFVCDHAGFVISEFSLHLENAVVVQGDDGVRRAVRGWLRPPVHSLRGALLTQIPLPLDASSLTHISVSVTSQQARRLVRSLQGFPSLALRRALCFCCMNRAPSNCGGQRHHSAEGGSWV